MNDLNISPAELEIVKNIYHSIENGNLKALKTLIADNPSLRDIDTGFGTWLHIAADAGRMSIVKWLVEKAGIDVNRKAGMFDGNALNEAMSEGHLNIVRYLAKKGAELEVSSPERNPLFGAILNRNLEIVKFLLESGIDPTVNYSRRKRKTHTAYTLAMRHGCREIAAYIEEWIRMHPNGYERP